MIKSYNKNLYLGLVSTGKIYWSHRAICINRIQQFIKIELTMHTNILNIQSPKEKCTDVWWKKLYLTLKLL